MVYAAVYDVVYDAVYDVVYEWVKAQSWQTVEVRKTGVFARHVCTNPVLPKC